MKRRQWTPEEKMNIVLAGLKEVIPVVEKCRRHNISQTLYYRWRYTFLQGGLEGLAGKPSIEKGKGANSGQDRRIRADDRETDGQACTNKKRLMSDSRGLELLVELVEELRFPVETACRQIGIHKSTFYRYRARMQSKSSRPRSCFRQETIRNQVRALYQTHPTYGYRRIWALLYRG